MNRAKLLLVDPNISWDNVAARPRRNPRKGMRLDATLKRTAQVIPANGELMPGGSSITLVLPPILGQIPDDGNNVPLPRK